MCLSKQGFCWSYRYIILVICFLLLLFNLGNLDMCDLLFLCWVFVLPIYYRAVCQPVMYLFQFADTFLYHFLTLFINFFEFISEVGGKPKNGLAADGRNRRVLRDIGNLVKDADVGKPQLQINRPITRFWSFSPILLFSLYSLRKCIFKFDEVYLIFVGVYVQNLWQKDSQ